jgi:eukaryotic-like serine/threonine-protein kinase
MSRSSSPTSSDKPLGGRYRIINQLGVGGFGRTFLAEDLHLPGHPCCVVKQLKPQIRSDDTLQMARRCFNTEAQVLYQLGIHDRIPRLLAHFEDNQEFYLAQEFIEGLPLTKELMEGKCWTENQVLFFLKEVLEVLAFVHQRQVIHRDLKPSNLIRRAYDRRIVLIDFGAVKQVGTQAIELESGMTNLTISIGTQGYMPNEQLAGKPRFSSDIYAVGILGIQALTGIHPRHLGEDLRGEIAWHQHAPELNPAFIQVLDQMVRYDFRERYPTAIEVLEALEPIPMPIADPFILFPVVTSTTSRAEPGITMAPPTQSTNSAMNALPHGGDFSEADFTLSGEDLTPTALWETEQSDETPETHFGEPSGEPFGTARQGTAEQPGGQPVANGLNSTHWRNSASNQNSASNRSAPNLNDTSGLGDTSGTGLTHAISRPHPDQTATPEAAPSRLRRRWSRIGTAIALTAGLAIALSQAMRLQNRSFLPTDNPSVSAPSPTLPTDPKQRAALFLEQATQLRQKGQYAEALKLYDSSIALNSNSAEAYAGRCETLNQLNRPEEAIVTCNDALAYRPNYPEALWSQGNALMLENRTYEALKVYEGVTFSKPNFANGWVKRGVALQKLGRSAEALTALDEGIRLQRNSAEAWQTKGAALLTLQRYEEAIATLDKALQLNPNDANSQKLRRQAKAKLGR